MKAAVPSGQQSRVHTASDLTFGNYVYLMRTQDNWAMLGWHVDREYFIDQLTEVRDVRNELMHFTPDPLTHQQYAAVEGLLALLRAADPRPWHFQNCPSSHPHRSSTAGQDARPCRPPVSRL